MPYGVFGVANNPYIGKVMTESGALRQRTPTRKQALFLSNKYNAIQDGFYGGAAGGAKSDAILMAALQFVHVPGYSALILRRTFKMLSKPGALMARAHAWLKDTDAHWNAQDHIWTFPSGATLAFGHMEHEKNMADYQSAEYQFIGIDEVTDFTEKMVLFIQSRLRKTVELSYLPLRFRCASNPLGPGVGWTKRRYVTPCRDRSKANIFRVKVEDREEERFFIPASLKDNPYIDAKTYQKILEKQDPVTRARLLDGDWDAQQKGEVFNTAFLEVVTLAEVPMDRLELYRYWDLAGTSRDDNPNACNTAGVLYGVDKITGIDYILDCKKFMENPTEVEQRLVDCAAEDGRRVEIHIEQEPGQSGKSQIWAYQDRLSHYDVKGNLPNKQGSKEVRAKPIANKIGRKRVKIVEGDWNEDFFIDLTAFPSDGLDVVDALSGAYAVSRKQKSVKSTNRLTGARGTNRTPNISRLGKKVS